MARRKMTEAEKRAFAARMAKARAAKSGTKKRATKKRATKASTPKAAPLKPKKKKTSAPVAAFKSAVEAGDKKAAKLLLKKLGRGETAIYEHGLAAKTIQKFRRMTSSRKAARIKF